MTFSGRMRRTPATYVLIALLSLAFAVELARDAIGNDVELLALGALPDDGELHSQYWRLITYAFLHDGWVHFMLNTGLLAWIGPIVERRLGSTRFLILSSVAAVVSGLTIYLKHAVLPAPGVSLGASGILFAMLGSAVVLQHRSKRASKAPRIVLIGGIAASFVPGVSLAGHLAGLVVGVLLTLRHPAMLDSPQ
jgi:rhomboid protease GluP